MKEFWQGRRVLVTGHTGFKGSWLSLWLAEMGAQVHGLALAPTSQPNLYEAASLGSRLESTLCDIRDFAAVARAVRAAEPELVFHLAAQSLVRRSYVEPLETYAVNVMGTAHVLEALRDVPSVRAAVIVTTDKCYENHETEAAYSEDAPLGGHDPYASSKACAEHVVSAYRRSFLAGKDVRIATARSGNVIGGGDWSDDRLIPDLVRAWSAGDKLKVRNPDAVRPWQHVLEPLYGYLLLAEKLAGSTEFSAAWNFGPADADHATVADVVRTCASHWGSDANWQALPDAGPHEATLLKLNSSRACAQLGWHSRWPLETALHKTIEWYRRFYNGGENIPEMCLTQIDAFTSATRMATPA